MESHRFFKWQTILGDVEHFERRAGLPLMMFSVQVFENDRQFHIATCEKQKITKVNLF